MSDPANAYVGLPHAELCGLRRDYAKLLHAAAAVRKMADRHLQLIKQAMQDDGGTREFEASDHAVIRYLERIQGVDVNAIRDTITFNCANGADLIGDKLRGCDGFLYCLNGEGHVTTILPLDALIEEANERANDLRDRKQPNGQRRRAIRANRDFVASCDTRPEGGDSTEIEAPFTGGAVTNEDSADAQPSPANPYDR